jgi:hypothetical protein
MEKEIGAFKEQMHRILKPKGEVTKTRVSDLVNRMVRFFLNKFNLIRDRNLICFRKIFSYPCKKSYVMLSINT